MLLCRCSEEPPSEPPAKDPTPTAIKNEIKEEESEEETGNCFSDLESDPLEDKCQSNIGLIQENKLREPSNEPIILNKLIKINK